MALDVPAVHRFGGQDVREENLSQLPQVEELVSATAEGEVEVRTVFLQGCLLEMLCVLHWRRWRGARPNKSG